MARTIHDARLDSRSGRSRLKPRREPYWSKFASGCYIGYRKGSKGGSWTVRWRAPGGTQTYATLGAADDVLDADGLTALSFAEAQERARAWVQDAAAKRLLGRPAGPYTVADCLRDYVAWLKDARKSAHHVETYAKAHILPELGGIDTAALTTQRIEIWRTAIRRAKPRVRSAKGEGPTYGPEDP